ncbi:hypothetical protein EJD97_024314 [Solanum chilense]|uniref:Uncharacterized protein n=1 Tax=Solanum chilense TaxID=4083 RepID=A0A6N2AQZ1_SOLCI|nr:hypothetical protein EJD97_024314 [Solanum chilense]
MECQSRRRTTVCAAQGQCWHATHDVVRLCLLTKGHAGMPHLTLFDRLCCPRLMMACHAQHRQNMYAT